MKAVRIFGVRDARVVEVPVPDLGPQDVLCRVVRCGVCGTDWSIWAAEASFVKKGLVPLPMTPGHEWSGVVEKVGTEVDRFHVGDRVTGDGVVSCGVCPACLSGSYFDCPKMRAVGTVKAWDGAYAQFIMMPQRHLFHLPPAVDFDNAAMVEPAANAFKGVTRAGVKPGDAILVHGTGPIGIMAVRIAKLAGAATVIVTGRRASKLAAARALGADVTIDTTRQSVGEVVRKLCPAGVDGVVEASGSKELFRQSFDLMRKGSTLSLIAFYESAVDGFEADTMVLGDITIRPVTGGIHAMEPVLRAMGAGQLDFRSLITARYALDEAPRALEEVKTKSESRIKSMLDVSEAGDRR